MSNRNPYDNGNNSLYLYLVYMIYVKHICRCTHHSSKPILARGLASEIPPIEVKKLVPPPLWYYKKITINCKLILNQVDQNQLFIFLKLEDKYYVTEKLGVINNNDEN